MRKDVEGNFFNFTKETCTYEPKLDEKVTFEGKIDSFIKTRPKPEKFDLNVAYSSSLKKLQVDFTYKPWSIAAQYPFVLDSKYSNFQALTNVDSQGRTWVLQRDWDI